MENIILCDPTLNYFINEAEIDWNDERQINIRCTAIMIALIKWLDRKYPTSK